MWDFKSCKAALHHFKSFKYTREMFVDQVYFIKVYNYILHENNSPRLKIGRRLKYTREMYVDSTKCTLYM